MGKGTIISHYGDGKYSVELNLDRSRVTETIALLESMISDLETRIAAMEEGDEKTALQLQKTAYEKRKETLQNSIEDNPVVDAWCADYTTELSGEVGTLEIPGERGSVQIHPGYDGAGAYNSTRDGQLQPAAAGTPASVFYNLAMLPGWQKYKPTFRVGTIVADSIDYDANTCDVCLDPETSSQLNLVINQDAGFGGCETTTHSGFTDFCTDNPAHPLCTNTDDPDALYISDSQFDELVTVNSEVNASHPYLSDVAGWQTGDSWDLLGAGEAGDCEDLQLTKADSLINDYGWNAAHLRMAVCETELGTGHAVLIVETANRGTLVLDNRYDHPMQIERLPYRFLSRQKAGTTWEAYSTRLEAVPIEYMGTGAVVFEDGDRVVVEFEGQSWESPKVVGFESNPRPPTYFVASIQSGFASASRRYVVWNIYANTIASIPNAAGTGIVSFPCTYAEIEHWLDATSVVVSNEMEKTGFGKGSLDSPVSCSLSGPEWYAWHGPILEQYEGMWVGCSNTGSEEDSASEESEFYPGEYDSEQCSQSCGGNTVISYPDDCEYDFCFDEEGNPYPYSWCNSFSYNSSYLRTLQAVGYSGANCDQYYSSCQLSLNGFDAVFRHKSEYESSGSKDGSGLHTSWANYFCAGGWEYVYNGNEEPYTARATDYSTTSYHHEADVNEIKTFFSPWGELGSTQYTATSSGGGLNGEDTETSEETDPNIYPFHYGIREPDTGLTVLFCGIFCRDYYEADVWGDVYSYIHGAAGVVAGGQNPFSMARNGALENYIKSMISESYGSFLYSFSEYPSVTLQFRK